MLKRAAMFYFAWFGCALLASAQELYTTAISVGPDAAFGGFDLNFRFEPGAPVFGSGYHNFTIDSNSKMVFHGATAGGVGAGFSVVNDGDVLDKSHVDPRGNTLIGQQLNGYQLILDQPFLVGLHLSYLVVIPPTEERFGWARLKYTATGLQVLDQATALGGNGIIAGTTTVLPEPSTLSLITAGAVGLLFAHRRLKSRRENGPPVA